ncbi:MAG: 3',5'-cyclic-nucleotide phosphodiesterase [Bacteroidota bacterium]
MIRLISCAIIILITQFTHAQSSFQVVPLGVKGGSDESNLSAYMLAPANSNEYICLDAGTIHAGIEKAIALKTFNVPASVVLKQYIKGYFISHGHLDHSAGMIINSPDDTAKNIYAFPFVLDVLKEKYFSWKSWANFGDEGEAPALKKYHYTVLDTMNELKIANTSMSVKAFMLSHSSPYQSSAFLVGSGENYVLYLGDTGADAIEHSDRLRRLWQFIAPLIKRKKLKGIFIESSFPDEQPDKQLFGHLSPRLLMEEMKVLNSFCGDANALNGLPVIITHIKPVGNNEERIKRQLLGNNPFKLQLIFPEQGKKINL